MSDPKVCDICGRPAWMGRVSRSTPDRAEVCIQPEDNMCRAARQSYLAAERERDAAHVEAIAAERDAIAAERDAEREIREAMETLLRETERERDAYREKAERLSEQVSEARQAIGGAWFLTAESSLAAAAAKDRETSDV